MFYSFTNFSICRAINQLELLWGCYFYFDIQSKRDLVFYYFSTFCTKYDKIHICIWPTLSVFRKYQRLGEIKLFWIIIILDVGTYAKLMMTDETFYQLIMI